MKHHVPIELALSAKEARAIRRSEINELRWQIDDLRRQIKDLRSQPLQTTKTQWVEVEDDDPRYKAALDVDPLFEMFSRVAMRFDRSPWIGIVERGKLPDF